MITYVLGQTCVNLSECQADCSKGCKHHCKRFGDCMLCFFCCNCIPCSKCVTALKNTDRVDVVQQATVYSQEDTIQDEGEVVKRILLVNKIGNDKHWYKMNSLLVYCIWASYMGSSLCHLRSSIMTQKQQHKYLNYRLNNSEIKDPLIK